MQIVDFIRDNWQFISSAILALLTIIAMIIKKKPVNKYVDDFYGELVSLIQAAESTYGNGFGADKKKFVLSTFMARHPDYDVYCVSDAIEDILKSPQKKGDKDGKK